MKKLASYLRSAIFFFAAILVFLSLISYSPKDISQLTTLVPLVPHNLVGIGGAYLSSALIFLFGQAAYFFPFYLLCMGFARLEMVRFSGLGRNHIVNSISFVLFLASLSALGALFFFEETAMFSNGGLTGWFLADLSRKYLGNYGSFLTFSFLLVINGILLIGFFFVDFFKHAGQFFAWIWAGSGDFFSRMRREWQSRPRKDDAPLRQKVIKVALKPREAEKPKEKIAPAEGRENKEKKPEIKVYVPKVEPAKPKEDTVKKTLSEEEARKKMEALEKQAASACDPKNYKLPTADLLKVPPHQDYQQAKEDIEANIANLETTLAEFGVAAKVTSVQKGPVVTMYELQPHAGVKITQISTLADDIALAMKSSGVRVVAPIPGRGTVGVEIPNEIKQMVYLREVLEEKVFSKATTRLTMIVGKDVAGNPVVADLKEMPHLLIAGSTGSGKTVCVNSLISSILFKAKPDEVKFILVDPKMVELTPYSGIPHLLHPVICDSKKAFVALNWAVEEMERRYKMLAQAGVRNIDGYNKDSNKMPYIVIVVDELADLMLVARESVETSIQRLAQMSRAVGIHLVLATQRPSVDVITGIIKANFPARISFKVATKVDSRTVLDIMGAEKLLGKGDLLFLKPGAVKLIRAQGAFLDDEDIEALNNFIRAQGGPVYEQSITAAEKNKMLDMGSDELFDEAAKLVMLAKQASASILQRRMRIGYTRAARLLDLMEQAGLVGPFCGSKAREIIVNPEQYLAEREKEENPV